MCSFLLFVFFFFFKQKTAYEMRISDWSSDVCSSDLYCAVAGGRLWWIGAATMRDIPKTIAQLEYWTKHDSCFAGLQIPRACPDEIGRASCRERVCQYV